MEQVTAMKITGITLSNFRSHTEPVHFDFDDISYITGHNGSGKTTMAHAVCYVLFGVSYYGEQKIERLMNEKSDTVQVQLDFTDQNGTAHQLVRTKKKEKKMLLLDGYTVSQSAIEQMFCDRDTFLSMFNPTYLTENMGNEGRELILRYLKPVAAERVLDAIPSYRGFLEGIDLNTQSPEQLIKDYRTAVRKVEQHTDILKGQMQFIWESQQDTNQKLDELYSEKNALEEKLHQLTEKQFRGLNLDDIEIQRNILTEQLKKRLPQKNQILRLFSKS